MNVFIFIALVFVSTQAARRSDDDDWVHLPNKCEVCKFLSIEMKSALEETGKTKEVIETNYRFLDDKGAPPIKYVKSDIRFIEVMENVCSRILQYNLHKERDGSNRFAKGMSETFSTLHNLVHKGVNVVMDIPYELWNETSAEVSDLKKQGAAYARKGELYQVEEEEVGGLGGGTYSPYHMLMLMHMHLAHRPRNSECDVMVEQYEEVIEDWYKGSQEEDLMTYLCEKHVLKGQDTSCLKEIWHEKKGDPAAIAQDKKKKKSKKKAKGGEHNQNREKKVKKKKSKLDEHSDEQKTEEEGHTSDEEIQRSVDQERTEL